jgi:hypothetical protein
MSRKSLFAPGGTAASAPETRSDRGAVNDPGPETVHLLDELLDSSAEPELREDRADSVEPIYGGVVGEVVGRDATGRPVVQTTDPVLTVAISRATVPGASLERGSQVVLLFEQGDPARPILIGALQADAGAGAPSAEAESGAPPLAVLPFSATVDDERIVIQAEKEVVLKCGKASITLTRAGKVLLRGAYVSSRSSGVNRIKGGSVQIN